MRKNTDFRRCNADDDASIHASGMVPAQKRVLVWIQTQALMEFVIGESVRALL